MTSTSKTLLRSVALIVFYASLTACSTVNKLLDNDQAIDYKSSKSERTLEVPPDLTQLRGNDRFTRSTSAASQTNVAGNVANPSNVLPLNNKARLERLGAARYLVVDMPAEQVYPIALAFWRDMGFALSTESPQTGVIETDWSENRAKGPQSGVRKILGGILDGVFDSGERDKYRTRLERVGNTTEIYLSHSGTRETNVGDRSQANFKQLRRDGDVELENEFLRRLMMRFGTDERSAVQAVSGTVSAANSSAPDRARLLPANRGLEMDDAFDAAWRRVGLALDRSGFTIEDRNFATGEYFIRYARNLNDSQEGFFSKLFSNSKEAASKKLKLMLQRGGTNSGAGTSVTVQSENGGAVEADINKNLLTVLYEELR